MHYIGFVLSLLFAILLWRDAGFREGLFYIAYRITITMVILAVSILGVSSLKIPNIQQVLVGGVVGLFLHFVGYGIALSGLFKTKPQGYVNFV